VEDKKGARKATKETQGGLVVYACYIKCRHWL